MKLELAALGVMPPEPAGDLMHADGHPNADMKRPRRRKPVRESLPSDWSAPDRHPVLETPDVPNAQATSTRNRANIEAAIVSRRMTLER
jgi:hypothetical protein